jgi:aspartate aminotransferase
VGAWAPRAEQLATARLLAAPDAIAAYHEKMHHAVGARLTALHDGLLRLRDRGFPIEVVVPMGAIYLSARFALHGARTPDGAVLRTNEEIRQYLLHAAGVGVVPFQAFGLAENTGWFRLSVGALSMAEIDPLFERLERALQPLTGAHAPAEAAGAAA